MLESAKRNLKELAFFGLLERQTDSQKLFEDKFGIEFLQNFEQRNKTVAANTVISEDKLELIRKYNALDIELYEYATELFNTRLRRAS